ncbi:MAG: glycosyltransferase [Bacteroidales bacterium]|nr:glycosyltransferase [Bacteroidales bacterium]
MNMDSKHSLAHTKTISVIIPVYNASRYLVACMESCLSQTYRDFEVIAVNDGSTDNSLEILENYAQKDSRITIINKENGGLPRARETGIAKAKGEYIFFLDSDDTITPDALEVLWKEAQTSDCDIIAGGIVAVLESGKIILDYTNKYIYSESNQSLLCSLLAKTIPFSLCGKLIRKHLFENITYPYDYGIGEDAITTFEIIKAHHPTFSVVDRSVYNYIQRPGSMVNTHTTAIANQRMSFMMWVYNYLKDIEHSHELDNCIAAFFIQEYFTFLRDGGTDCPAELKELIYKKYLKNRWAVSQTAWWRLILVKMYKYPTLGRMARRILVGIRKLIR